MKPVLLTQLACWADGRLVRDAGVVQIDAVHTDSRTLPANGRAVLFIALAGAQFDGHAHVAEAAEKGARAALVAREIDCDLPQIVVENTEHALAALAANMQRPRRTRTLAITGSNGKTTVKQLTASILLQVGRTYSNPGNRNNQIGLPLAVIDAPEDAAFAVYEMGAGQPGDIAWLADIARAEIALINNIAPAHLERMHNLLGIAQTKAAIYDTLADDGVAIINADDAFAEFFAARIPGRRILRFGLEADADVSARKIRHQADNTRFVLVMPAGEIDITLPLPGRHNVANALAAAALAHAAGAPPAAIAAGLAASAPVRGRMFPYRLANGTVLIDDSYNANPGSLSAAIDALGTYSPFPTLSPRASLPAPANGRSTHNAPTWLVLGDMRELGPQAQTLHAAAGEQARKLGITRLFTLGTLSTAAAQAFGTDAHCFATHDALIHALRDELAHTTPPPVMLIKGSRGSAMERVVTALLADGEARHAA